MVQIKIWKDGQNTEIVSEQGQSLLQILHTNRQDIYAPCGGNGVCGKCLVHIKGEGAVSSCVYYPDHDIEIILPGKREATILVSQSEHLQQVPLFPDESVNLSSFPHGIAIDIGTTSLVFYLVNLITGQLIETKACLNPQAKYGSDVISRINFCQSNPDGLKILQNEIITQINQTLEELIQFASIGKEDIVKITIVGNTTMLHLLLAVNPLSIALAPFKPVFTEKQIRNGEELKLNCNSKATIKLLPSLSAYVGADIIAGITSLKNIEQQNSLFIDIGTNGEMALITSDRIYACATAAGPAFEGANISCGTGGIEGAISEYTNGSYKTISNGQPIGICGSGILDIVASLLDSGKINFEGYMSDDFLVYQSDEIKITVSPQDIREIQLAKSAIASGIKIMMAEAGLEYDDIHCLYLAGGFGNYLNKDSAVRIGLLPEELKNRIIMVGNSAGAGAMQSLKSVAFDQQINTVLGKCKYIELSGREDFEMEFAMNMYFS